MTSAQADLFGNQQPAAAEPSEEMRAVMRARLRKVLALVKGAPAMPWTEMADIIREDNAFRWGKDMLPPEEGAALWAEFEVEMDRLYAVMNEGKEMPDY